MNKPQILYCVLDGAAELLILQGDFPNKSNCLLYQSDNNGELITIYQEDLETQKHIYFTDRNEAMKQCVQWHQIQISKLEKTMNEKIPADGKGQ